MSIRVEIDDVGVRKLLVDLEVAKTGIAQRVAGVHREAGPRIVKTAVRNAPEDTGALKRSIGFSVSVRNMTLRFGPLKESINPKTGKPASTYFGYVHDGGAHPPRPFLANAIKEHSGPSSALMRGYATAGLTPIDRALDRVGLYR